MSRRQTTVCGWIESHAEHVTQLELEYEIHAWFGFAGSTLIPLTNRPGLAVADGRLSSRV
jgi:hypothetical protein